MFTLMRDPVLLPSSKIIIDLATIKSHLLSDSKDPFNRAPLSIEDVIPGLCVVSCHNRKKHIVDNQIDVEMKQRIETFLLERRQKKADPDRPPTPMEIDGPES